MTTRVVEDIVIGEHYHVYKFGGELFIYDIFSPLFMKLIHML